MDIPTLNALAKWLMDLQAWIDQMYPVLWVLSILWLTRRV
jgi:hypothetical protein